jgi:hypothetical protein
MTPLKPYAHPSAVTRTKGLRVTRQTQEKETAWMVGQLDELKNYLVGSGRSIMEVLRKHLEN